MQHVQQYDTITESEGNFSHTDSWRCSDYCWWLHADGALLTRLLENWSDVYIAEWVTMSAAASNGAVASTTPHQLRITGISSLSTSLLCMEHL